MPLLDAFLRPVKAVTDGANASEAARVLRDEQVGALLVLDGEGRAIGIVTDRDLALRIVGARLDPQTTPIVACMSRPLISLRPGDSALEAARRMRERLVRRLPILDAEGRPLGMVTSDDLLADLGRNLAVLSQVPGQGFENERRAGAAAGSIFGKE